MKKTIFSTWGGRVAILLMLVFSGSGCATNRGILDIQVQPSPNPDTGQTVSLVSVQDLRTFEHSPRKPSIPSLKGDEIKDSAITSRAIARKRNGYGKAIGDILLPEGRTVEDVTREAVTRAFREAGYRVVDSVDAEPDVIPVDVDIEQFWAWVTPGFWAIKLDFQAGVRIKGDIEPFKESEVVTGELRLKTMAAGTKAWRNILTKGVEKLVQNVKTTLDDKKIQPRYGPGL